MISVILVTYNNCGTTLACLASLYAHHAGAGFEVILVDNASADDTVHEVRQAFPAVRVLAQSGNFGFGAANNIGARAARGETLLFLNNDTCFTAPLLEELAGVLHAHAGCSAVAPRLVDPDGTFQVSVGFMPSILGERRTKHLQDSCALSDAAALREAQRSDPDWVTAAALMVRADAFRNVGGFDERFFMYFEDVDLCIRLRSQCGAIRYEPSLSLIHIGGGSWKAGREEARRIRTTYRRSQLLFYAKHHGLLQNMLLRCFLAAKFGPRALSGDADARSVMAMLATPPSTLLK